MSCLMAVYITGFPIGEISNAKYPSRDFFLTFFLNVLQNVLYEHFSEKSNSNCQ